MDDEKIRRHFQSMNERFVELARETTNLKATVKALQVALAVQVNPSDPLAVLKQLREAEELILKSDPNAQELARVEELIEAAKLWQKHDRRES